MARVLVTGGAGYIGSHTCIELLDAGYEVVVLDNLSNSNDVSLEVVREVARRGLVFVRGDIRDAGTLRRIFRQRPVDAVLHFAGLKSVGESVASPLGYYDNNVRGTVVLLEAMAEHEVTMLVFSSSCTVYGNPQRVPVTEDAPTGAANPYGRTKLFIEQMLEDVSRSDERWKISLLRYFNPVGAHPTGRLGEDSRGAPNNLLPYLSQVAVGRLPCLQVFGNDYSTKDGTGVRDYVHVVDLARGHLAALRHLESSAGIRVHNLGTGLGYSVLEVVGAFERASGRRIPYRITGRRPGDVAACYADPTKALRELGWRATRDLDTMCRDAWRWQQSHPFGFREGPLRDRVSTTPGHEAGPAKPDCEDYRSLGRLSSSQ